MDSKYLTIAEFAAAAGVSKQAVYRRLGTSALAPFVLDVNGKKNISTDAANLFNRKPTNKSTSNNQAVQDLLNQLSTLNKNVESIKHDISIIISELESIKSQHSNQFVGNKRVNIEQHKTNSIESTTEEIAQRPVNIGSSKRLQIRIFLKGDRDKPLKCFSGLDREELDQRANAWLTEHGYPTYQQSVGKSFRWEV